MFEYKVVVYAGPVVVQSLKCKTEANALKKASALQDRGLKVRVVQNGK